jgi:hypothetical protein
LNPSAINSVSIFAFFRLARVSLHYLIADCLESPCDFFGIVPRVTRGSVAANWRHRFRVDANGFRCGFSYRSARINQNANPPVLCRGRPAAAVLRTPNEPFLPVFRHPRRSMIMRIKTPIA